MRKFISTPTPAGGGEVQPTQPKTRNLRRFAKPLMGGAALMIAFGLGTSTNPMETKYVDRPVEKVVEKVVEKPVPGPTVTAQAEAPHTATVECRAALEKADTLISSSADTIILLSEVLADPSQAEGLLPKMRDLQQDVQGQANDYREAKEMCLAPGV